MISTYHPPRTIASGCLSAAIKNRNPHAVVTNHLSCFENVARTLIAECMIAISLVVSIAESIFFGLASLYSSYFDSNNLQETAKYYLASMYTFTWCLVALVENIYAQPMNSDFSPFLNGTAFGRLIKH